MARISPDEETANRAVAELGSTPADHLYRWAARRAPDWLAALAGLLAIADPRTRLAELLRYGDAGYWLLPDDRLPRATADALRRWIAMLITGPDELRSLTPGAAGGWQRVTDAALAAVLPDDDLTSPALVAALKPLLLGIGRGELDFAGERRRVRVFQRSDDPSTSEGTAAPEPEDAAAANPEPAPETGEAMPRDPPVVLLNTEADAFKAYQQWRAPLVAERQPPSRDDEYRWADQQVGRFHITQAVIRQWRRDRRAKGEQTAEDTAP
jgi:hypothetical protein